jgi:hypothetical protein
LLYHVAKLYGSSTVPRLGRYSSQGLIECPSNSEEKGSSAQHEQTTNMFLYGNTRLRPTADQVSPSMVSTGHRDDYKHSKEAFVSGMTGSTVSHINVIALVALVRLHPLFLDTAFAYDETTRPPSRCTPPSAHARHHRTPFCSFRNGYSSLSLFSSQ